MGIVKRDKGFDRQTGNFRKPSRLAFAGVVWDAGRRREGGVDLLRVSFWSGGSWNRVPSHSVPSQYKKWEKGHKTN